jgi:7,8-dihydropterin-6-yl-methyl-4-(beta-D-ribofuranosyl)aminobenzene 5'-phosphate synthase
MRVIALVENTRMEDMQHLVAEHGLSLYIERNGTRILFDTGATEAFGRNAERLGVNLQDVDAAVISHHHFDHGGGLAHFLETNHRATVYLKRSEAQDFYFRALGVIKKYVGLDAELLQQHADRFVFVDQFTEILQGVYILTEIVQRSPIPKGNRWLFVSDGGSFSPDSFEHELVMAVREGDELVVFTGCAHSGILNMMETVTRQFEGFPIKAVFGGFHLVDMPLLKNSMAGTKEEVRHIGEQMLRYPVEHVYTGHCTGKKAYRVLKGVMQDKLDYFPTGSDVVL